MANQATTAKIIQFNNSNSLIDLTNKSGAEITAAMWGMSPTTIKEASNIATMYRSKHGMFSSVPILCQGKDCPYSETCMVDMNNRPYGQRCPMEIAAILSRFDQWCDHFNISSNDTEIETKDLVDATLIKDLVVIEIQMLRAENKIALSGDFIGETLVDIDKKCKPYYGMTITPESEFLLTLQERKIKILNQLNSTRKDKSQDKKRDNISDEAIKIFQKIREIEKNGNNINNTDIMDVEFDDEGNIIVNEPENSENTPETAENTENQEETTDNPSIEDVLNNDESENTWQ